jgi:hypothetical protein
MDDGNDIYIPNAYFAFKSKMHKHELVESIDSIVMRILHIPDRGAITPWKINIYHINEFAPYSKQEEIGVIEMLKDNYGRDTTKPKETTCLSTNDVTINRNYALKLLNNPNVRAVVEKAREKKLNYIFHGVYNDDSLLRVNRTDDSKVLNALQKIVSEIVNIKNRDEIINLKDFFYAYTDKGEIKFFS